jgi:protocatechuate 3,4-dioxygenase beta subunit
MVAFYSGDMNLGTRTHELDHDDFGGLARDLPRLISRRGALKLFAGAGLLTLAGCSSSGSTSTADSADSADSADTTDPSATLAAELPETTVSATSSTADTVAGVAASGASCDVIPSETAGPYPGDGSNGPNILNQDGVVRSDIRTSIGSASSTALGVPLTVTLKVVSAAASCAPLPGASVYMWHVDANGNYSMYSEAVLNENYLRGVQTAGDDGTVTFQTVYPGCYQGRWPHIHFEVYADQASALAGSSPLVTSQIAMPKAESGLVYANVGYLSSVDNFANISLESDMVFSDTGGVSQTPTISGDATTGFTAVLTIPV